MTTTQPIREEAILPTRHYPLVIGLTIALLLRFALACLPYYFKVDMNDQKGWLAALLEVGFGEFYRSGWSDYPPGYFYVLWVIGKIYQLFDPYLQHTNGTLLNVFIKSVPILADIGGAVVIFAILRSRVTYAVASGAALLYAFNPLTIFISAVWSQVDSVLALAMLLVVWALLENRFFLAVVIGSIATLMKPQGIFLVPIYLFLQWPRLAWWKWPLGVLSSLAIAWGMTLPFYWLERDFSSISGFLVNPILYLLNLLLKASGTYPYVSVNAFNFWGFMNWQPDAGVFAGLSYKLWGLVGLVVFLGWMAIFFYRQRQKPAAIFLGVALVLIGMFMFPTRMHERYIFYAVPFTLLASVFIPRLQVVYWGLTLTAFLNAGYAYLYYENSPAFDHWWPVIQVLTICVILENIRIFGTTLAYTFRWAGAEAYSQDLATFENQSLLPPAILSSWPQGIQTIGQRFQSAIAAPAYITSTPQVWDWRVATAGLGLMAIAFGMRLWHLDKIPYPTFDEFLFVPYAKSYLEGGAEGPTWEGHPPLAKYFILWSIQLLGDNVYGYRMATAIAGSLIPGLVMGIAYRLTGRWLLSLMAGAFLLTDGLFLVESRFGLINTFLVCFGLMSQMLLLLALERQGAARTGLLCLCGVMLGATVSVKWNGLGFTLTTLTIAGLVWAVALLAPQQLCRIGVFAEITRLRWWHYLLCFVLIPFSVYFLQWVPHLLLSPIFKDADHTGIAFFSSLWDSFLAAQRHLLWWHNEDVMMNKDGQLSHPYCSPWYTWPLDARPVAYYYDDQGGQIIDVHAQGNPILWWLSLSAILIFSVIGLQRFQMVPAYLLVAYATNYLPWMLVKRCVFIYHYMESSTFSFIALAILLWAAFQRKRWRWLAGGALVTIVAAQFYFLPFWYGLPITAEDYYHRLWFQGQFKFLPWFNWI